MALIGDTVRLIVDFKNFNNEYVDPSNIVLRVYDTSRNKMSGDINIGTEQKVSLGKYQYDYPIPETKKDLVYEFVGYYNEKPILGRGIIKVLWVQGL